MLPINLITVVYIMGSGRSGSTILDIIMGNHPDLESVGELTNLVQNGWINGEFCSCKQRGNLCPYWTKIRLLWLKKTGINDVAIYLQLQKQFENFRNPITWLKLTCEKLFPSKNFREYSRLTRALFESIQEVSGKTIIVDSSKNPARCLALSLISGIDLKVVHWIRDGRGVAWSLKKTYLRDEKAGIQKDLLPRPVWRSALFWVIVNLQSSFVRCRIAKRMAAIWLRYEDFAADPVTCLNKIGSLIKIDFTLLAQEIEAGKELKMGHLVAGNGIRMSQNLRFSPNVEWIKKMSKKEQDFFWIIAGWLLKKYNYIK